MRAMILERIAPLRSADDRPLRVVDRDVPTPTEHDLLLDVRTCGVCHTELDEIEGRTPPPRLPVVLGHQVVGVVRSTGSAVRRFAVGDRVGVAWIHSACGHCEFCTSGRENLCPDFRATGRDVDGGYAEHMLVDEAFAHALPDAFDDLHAAPLLCAGAIGQRSVRLTGLATSSSEPASGRRVLGLTGFGASAHLVLQLVRAELPDVDVFVFTRSEESRRFALDLGAAWAGDTDETPPARVHAVIDTTPAWKPVLAALRVLVPGGRLVINAIRKEAGDAHELASLDYAEHLWREKEIKSVANVTRDDVRDFLVAAAGAGLRSTVREFPLEDANAALWEMRSGTTQGAKVLRVR